METFATRLHQSQSKIGKILSEFEHILNQRKSKDITDMYQKKVEGYADSCKDQLEQQHEENASNKQHLKERQCAVELLQTKKEAEKILIDSLHEELQHLQKEQKIFSKDPVPNVSEEKIRQLISEEALFKENIAIDIEKVKGGWLQVVFTQIDPRKHSRKFFFLLRLDEDRRYVVGDCQPPIDDMEILLKRLNASNSLSKFVHSVRKRFKRSVQN